jgi:type IV secretion system protein VirD4
MKMLPAPLDSPLPCSRPLLTPDEAMRMKGARKNAQGKITEAGNMVVYVAGYPAIMGLQPLYFRDPELARRARLAAESAQAKKSPTLANARKDRGSQITLTVSL